VLPYLEGEYGIQNLFVGVPVKARREGIEKIFEARLTEEGTRGPAQSAAAVKELVDVMAPSWAEVIQHSQNFAACDDFVRQARLAAPQAVEPRPTRDCRFHLSAP